MRRDDVVDRLDVPVRPHHEVDLRRARADVVGDGEGAAPRLRRHRAAERREQRLGVAVRNRQHRDLRDDRDVLQREALGVLGGADAGRQRVADVVGVHDAAALHALARAERAVGERRALEVAVVAGVGVDQAPDRAVLGGDLGLDAAPGVAVARDHDRALDRDPQALQAVVVVGHAVVDVDERSRHVAVGRVRVVGRKLLLRLPGGRVRRDGRLLQRRDEPGRRDHLQPALLRRREQHLERLDPGVEPPRLELRQDPLGVVLVVRRADGVRPRREPLHVRAQVRRVRDRAELRLPPAFDPCRSIGKPRQPGLVRWSRAEREHCRRRHTEEPATPHGSLPLEKVRRQYIQVSRPRPWRSWMPAFAGMTTRDAPCGRPKVGGEMQWPASAT